MNTPKRKTFARVRNILEYPDFLDVQFRSFEEFVQADCAPEDRKNAGLQKVFLEHFPIQDSRERSILEFIHYSLDPPKHTIEECIEQGLTYAVPLKARLRLSSNEDEDEDEAEEAIESEVYLGNLPAMTNRATFIINGAERVIVSQLHRSPGVFFGQSQHPNGTTLYSARVIPFRGSWVEFTTDVSNLLWAYIDRKKKLPVTTLLRALGFSSDASILRLFDLADEVLLTDMASFSSCVGRMLAADIAVEGKIEVIDEDTGEVVSEKIERSILIPADTQLKDSDFDVIRNYDIDRIYLLKEDQSEEIDKSSLLKTLRKDPTTNEKQALEYIYEQLRGSEAPDEEAARTVLERLFFS
ncbi:MAG TPA: DNA-directed RNA polymerase subunit beta, partial [Rhodothermales bacterium]|nr:DNA-directed RNA polymerase subunit beta [Rhodothermales bacterium]